MDAWIQCPSGASGDMLLGALIDAGASLDVVRAAVGAVGVDGIEIRASPVRRAGMAALKADVLVTESGHDRTWSDVRRLLDDAGQRLDPAVRDRAVAVFGRLAEAEGRVHGVPADEVHFHEVGALDAIADVIGVCAAVDDLGLRHIGADTVAVGSGTVETSHGRLGVPVPAVVDLLTSVGAPVSSGPSPRELCTPTGAALLATLVDRWGPMPAMRMTGAGAGAGTADLAEAPNVLRVVLGEFLSEGRDGGPHASDSVVLEANVDDLDPRLWPAVLDRLLAAGADDAWLTPILMKKGRPAHTVSALLPPARLTAVRDVLFRETSSIGARVTPVSKVALERTEAVVDIDGHVIRVKLAWLSGEVVNAQPEYDDVAAAAAASGQPVKTILARAAQAAVDAGS